LRFPRCRGGSLLGACPCFFSQVVLHYTLDRLFLDHLRDGRKSLWRFTFFVRAIVLVDHVAFLVKVGASLNDTTLPLLVNSGGIRDIAVFNVRLSSIIIVAIVNQLTLLLAGTSFEALFLLIAGLSSRLFHGLIIDIRSSSSTDQLPLSCGLFTRTAFLLRSTS